MLGVVNDLYPGSTPVGTQVEVLSLSRGSALIRNGKRTVKVSPNWIDLPSPGPFAARALRTVKGVLG